MNIHFFLAAIRGAALAVIGCTISLHVHADPYTGTCSNGAPAREEQYCRFFVRYNTDPNTPLDVRISDALGVNRASETRSIGFVIAIDKYPNIPGGDIPAAAVDGTRLVDFLVDKQKFDEVILLRNEEASVDTINYFLEDYLPNRANEFNKKARLLIAYSGHGRYGTSDGTAGAQAAFVLSNATDVNASSNVYKMQNFATDVEALSSQYFHILTLVNACYGGGFFRQGISANADAFTKPGSYAITAGSDGDPVPALIPSRGSIFFDLIIEGVSRGSADPLYWDVYRINRDDGTNATTSGLTRTLALANFLISSYGYIVQQHAASDPKFSLSDPWLGPAQPGIARGGFFFLSDRTGSSSMDAANTYRSVASASTNFGLAGVANSAVIGVIGTEEWAITSAQTSTNHSATTAAMSTDESGDASAQGFPPPAPPPPEPAPTSAAAAQLAIPSGPVSSIVGRPDIKIFKAPEIYPIQGFDLSSEDGEINWPAFADSEQPRFIYARAIGWAGIDKSFAERWQHIKALNIDYGAYFKFDFCMTPSKQLARLAKVVPIDRDQLPIAVEIVDPHGENERQLACFDSLGQEAAQKQILELAAAVRARYGKTPLLYGNRNNLSKLLDERSYEFMVWLGSYGATGTRLSGRNPWTIWQYSGTLNVKGVGKKSTGEVFFGTEEQYELFKTGRFNVGLQAVTPAMIP